MGGGEKRRFGCVRGVLFVDNAAVVHDQDTVTDELDFGELTGIEQYRRAAGRQLIQIGRLYERAPGAAHRRALVLVGDNEEQVCRFHWSPFKRGSVTVEMIARTQRIAYAQ